MNYRYYSAEKNIQSLIYLLKAHNIKKIVTSPGATNLTFVASIQQDSYFEVYSSVDERSAAYIACGMAAESGEPVVLSCTGATASRNYLPGMTEAFYRKLPVVAVTSNSGIQNQNRLIAQNIDRSVIQRDVAKISVDVPVIKDAEDAYLANLNINKALLELKRHGGGPVHINLSTTYSGDFSVKDLPEQRVIERVVADGLFPDLATGKRVAIFVGSHHPFSEREEQLIDAFCASHNAVVFCDHTSGYQGKYRVMFAPVCIQQYNCPERTMDILIHLGEVSGDYYGMGLNPGEVWRVAPDGELHDTFRKMRYVFEMSETSFFSHYADGREGDDSYLTGCLSHVDNVMSQLPELPFGNIWIASQISRRIPSGAALHLGILNTLRSWNFFPVTDGVETWCNVGGFGIDGCMSTLIGASLVNPQKLFFGVIGDLSFFYDLNSMANRHVGNNLRIMLINNGRGTEFTNFGHPGHNLGKDADPFVAAAGHYGRQSRNLVKHYAEDLGFTYLAAANKQEFLTGASKFLSEQPLQKPIMFEVFTDSQDESDALEMMFNLVHAPKTARGVARDAVVGVFGEKCARQISKIIRRQ